MCAARCGSPNPKSSSKTVEYKVLYDTTQAVRASLREVVRTLFITFVLVVAVTFLPLRTCRSGSVRDARTAITP